MDRVMCGALGSIRHQGMRLALRVGIACLLSACATSMAQDPKMVSTSTSSEETPTATYGEHVVQPGETLWRISRQAGTTVQTLASINGISDPTQIRVGTRLKVPKAAAPPVARANPAPKVADKAKSTTAVRSTKLPNKNSKYPLRWPVDGQVTSRFGQRQGRAHDGVDIAAAKGAKIRAANDGAVVFSGVHGDYGNMVLIRHSDGLVTVYAHNSVNLVRKGQTVRQGQEIAKVGQTGRATAPHLHFEVRRGVKPENPLRFLPP